MKTREVTSTVATIMESQLANSIQVTRDPAGIQPLSTFEMPNHTLIYFLPRTERNAHLYYQGKATIETFIRNLSDWVRGEPFTVTYPEVRTKHTPETLKPHGTAVLRFSFSGHELREKYGCDLIPFMLGYGTPEIIVKPSQHEKTKVEGVS